MNLTFKTAVRLTLFQLKNKDLKGFIRQFKYLLSVIKQQLEEQICSTKFRFKIQEDILVQRNFYNNLENHYNNLESQMKEITKKRNNEIIEKYKQGNSIKDLMKEFNLTKFVILKVLNQNGFYLKGRTMERINRNKKIYKKFKNGKSINELANEFNVSTATVNAAIKNNKRLDYQGDDYFNIQEFNDNYFFHYNS